MSSLAISMDLAEELGCELHEAQSIEDALSHVLSDPPDYVQLAADLDGSREMRHLDIAGTWFDYMAPTS